MTVCVSGRWWRDQPSKYLHPFHHHRPSNSGQTILSPLILLTTHLMPRCIDPEEQPPAIASELKFHCLSLIDHDPDKKTTLIRKS